MIGPKALIGAVGFAATVGFATQAYSTGTKPALSLDMAKKMADACEAHQAERAERDFFLPINIAIYDDGGNLKLFRRQDGAFLGSGLVARMKAQASSSFPFPSRALGELTFGAEGRSGPLPGLAFIPGHAMLPGGLPIITPDGRHIGAIGVSGATGELQDEDCAQAALEAIADMLN